MASSWSWSQDCSGKLGQTSSQFCHSPLFYSIQQLGLNCSIIVHLQLSEQQQQSYVRLHAMITSDIVQALLDAWYPLWRWVFQPAIGVLMLGAVSAPLTMIMASFPFSSCLVPDL